LFLNEIYAMANANIELIHALRETASRLRNGAYYAWGHHGGCNCGNLLQVVTHLTKEEIVRYAHTGIGEWTEIAEEYCSVSDAPLYLMMSKLEKLGLTPTDIHNIEYLEDRKVLNYLAGGFRWLKRNVKEDVIAYFEAFANLLEEQLINSISLPPDVLQVQPAKKELHLQY
jgi:hypothetical protein